MLKLTDITIQLHETCLFKNFNASIPTGEVLSIMGPSGCGKSTLLDFLSGSIADTFKTSGQINLNNKELSHLPIEKRHVGILYQESLLFPHLSNLENLMFAIPETIKGKQRAELALEKLSEFNLADKAHTLPAYLSGGQKARISLLRTLLSEPKYLLLDEPFGKLDKALRQEVREFVIAQIETIKLPTILVTHDQDDADAMGGTLVQLTR
ncbi:ATP-binding cassette domain-containing protein [Marinomonas sp. 15G1-11]|uniref:ATP-binding cassette domain-containing protein n=1 Tax=Marinomonas phaeophyticola TaxID=3004091 RepID=A0ABT4JQ23_9GAMM|nr:ATP-binding cassette domain-containing protein [Marinomonas sp. 15G1-11]MCZ2720330.1 ATP-binding cassette domain-containing protein [Marinomonas sp. 15G1-11]